jgi:hypothetical protein
MSNHKANLCSSQSQQDYIAKISHLSTILKNISQNFIGNLEVEIIKNALQELEDACQELLLVWNSFCIIPILYLIEPVFRYLRIMIVLPISSVTVSCASFLNCFANIRVKLHSSITAERIFSSIFDCSTLNMLILNFRTAIEPNATKVVQSQLIGVSATVCLLSDLLQNGAADLHMSTGLIALLFDLYYIILLNLDFEDESHSVLCLKCSSTFPIVLKLRSKSDIVLSCFQSTKSCSEGFIRDFRSRNFRIHAWAALGLEISPFLHRTFSECLKCKTDPANDKLIDTASYLLSKICRRPQLVCSSKLLGRSCSAIQCVRLVIDALNRWRHHLATSGVRHEVEKFKNVWFASQSSFVLPLLLYCFDSIEIIRNQAISTLREIGTFYPSLFAQPDNAQLIFDALSAILELSNCPRIISDVNWIRDLRNFGEDFRILPRCPFLSTVRFSYCIDLL